MDSDAVPVLEIWNRVLDRIPHRSIPTLPLSTLSTSKRAVSSQIYELAGDL